MSGRSVRLLLLLLAVTASGAAAYRGFFNERHRQDLRAAARLTDRAAEDALSAIADLRASLHAYVAEGQGEAFWAARVTSLLDTIRTEVLHMDGARPGAPTADVLDRIDQLAAADRRARDFLLDGQPLMAADVIFTDIRDVIEALTQQIAGQRSALAQAAGAREAELMREQYQLAGGALGAWMLAALLLFPRTGVRAPETSDVLHVAPQRELIATDVEALRLNEGFDEPLNLTLAPDARAADPVVRSRQSPPSIAENSAPAPARQAPVPIEALALLCGDLARVTDAASLNPLLARTAAVLDATGLVLWMATPDGEALQPAAAHGYDTRVLARVGPVPRGAANLTASVFREGVPHNTPPAGTAPAAVAVPVAGAGGTIGVLSAEVTESCDLDVTMAGAAIVAAQLAALLGAPVPEAPAAARRSAS